MTSTPSIMIAVAAMGGLGFVFAAFLAIADKKLRVHEDPLVEELLGALPNTNCGACGVAGCHQVAENLVAGTMPINACTAGGQDVTDLVARILGVESVKANRVVAVLLCRGGTPRPKKAPSTGGRSPARPLIRPAEKKTASTDVMVLETAWPLATSALWIWTPTVCR